MEPGLNIDLHSGINVEKDVVFELMPEDTKPAVSLIFQV